ncbi:DUF6355 family natural product biosynthesis protein [Allokutzneria sp. A3M-2-11 16]|uniref:DUF6355 family natural product biosynthesis protein n=1 Tax=Allokutzneria sp. A3M-2-11 16 TaxID=2962043 RepID=UPI0020B8C5E6|nr:DUF6355 family natural product biosynthesis protein [Allokutzneria sp. A3M-2-11 16]MCP3804702.1 DUF6355 family natural product biosynthesis protein [Allokutzneria sp. A3M-2-11 16]
MRRRTSATLAVVAAAAALSLTGAAPAIADDTASARGTCGFYHNWPSGLAYYNHCDNRTKVLISVDKWPHGDVERCVGPGITHIGAWPYTKGAHYIGRTC